MAIAKITATRSLLVFIDKPPCGGLSSVTSPIRTQGFWYFVTTKLPSFASLHVREHWTGHRNILHGRTDPPGLRSVAPTVGLRNRCKSFIMNDLASALGRKRHYSRQARLPLPRI